MTTDMPERPPIPVILDADDLVMWACDNLAEITADDLQTMVGRVGRNAAPALLYDLHCEFGPWVMGRDVYAQTGEIWSAAEYPCNYLELDQWRELFGQAGFCIDGQYAPRRRPRKPVRLWRGSVPECRDRWSWTYRRDVAVKFASGGYARRPEGRVWTALVEPGRLLCRADDRQEFEYVVDTEGLAVEEDCEG